MPDHVYDSHCRQKQEQYSDSSGSSEMCHAQVYKYTQINCKYDIQQDQIRRRFCTFLPLEQLQNIFVEYCLVDKPDRLLAGIDDYGQQPARQQQKPENKSVRSFGRFRLFLPMEDFF